MVNPNEDLTVERLRAPVFPEDAYDMEIKDPGGIQNFDRPAFNNPDETVPSFQITFVSNYKGAAGEDDPWEFTWFVSKSLSSRSNLFKLAKAALGSDFDETSDTFDANELIGKKVRLILKTETSQQGREYSKVETVLAVKVKVPRA